MKVFQIRIICINRTGQFTGHDDTRTYFEAKWQMSDDFLCVGFMAEPLSIKSPGIRGQPSNFVRLFESRFNLRVLWVRPINFPNLHIERFSRSIRLIYYESVFILFVYICVRSTLLFVLFVFQSIFKFDLARVID